MRVFRVLVPVLALFAAMTARAEDVQPQPDQPGTRGLAANVKLGVTLLQSTRASSENRYTFWAAAGADYFFAPAVGAFAEAQYMNRGIAVGTSENSGSYLDIPFGLAFNLGRSMYGATSTNKVRLGGFAAVPLGDFSGNLGATYINTQAFFGIYFEQATTFPVAEGFGIGYTVWFKYGFGNAVALTTDTKFLEMGLGFAFTF